MRLSMLVTACICCLLVGPVWAPAIDGTERPDAYGGVVRPPVPIDFLGPGPTPARLNPTKPKTAGQNISVNEAIIDCVESDMAVIGAPGALVTVIHGGEEIFNRGFGLKRRNGIAPVDSGTRFRIGSITKMLTAAAAMPDFYEDPTGPVGDQALADWAVVLTTKCGEKAGQITG